MHCGDDDDDRHKQKVDDGGDDKCDDVDDQTLESDTVVTAPLLFLTFASISLFQSSI